MSGPGPRKILKPKRKRPLDPMDVDDDTPNKTHISTLTTPSPASFMGPAAPSAPGNLQAATSVMFGSAQGSGATGVSTTPRTYAGQFLSHSASIVSTQNKPALYHPSSLQSVPSATEIITMKDPNGIVRAYPVDQPTYQYVRSIISGRSGLGMPTQGTASATATTPFATSPSMGSLPSSSSLYSSTSSVSSQASTFSTTPGRNPAATLKVLYDMLEAAQTPEDIAAVKMRIQQTIFDIDQEAAWKKHMSGEVSQTTENGDIQHENDSGNSYSDDGAQKSDTVFRNCETSSATCNRGHLVSKPKKDFLQKVNLVINRFLQSKL